MKPKVLIAIPSTGYFVDTFSICLTKLACYSIMNGVDCMVAKERGAILPKNRNKLAQQAVDTGCTHILFIDSDSAFPASTLNKLLAHDKDIIAINYVTKQSNARFTAMDLDGNIYNSKNKTGLVEVGYAGTGTILIKTEVFKNIRKPYFINAFIDEAPADDCLLGEDLHFSCYAKQAGYKIYIDNDLSNKVQHIGLHAFGVDNVKED